MMGGGIANTTCFFTTLKTKLACSLSLSPLMLRFTASHFWQFSQLDKDVQQRKGAQFISLLLCTADYYCAGCSAKLEPRAEMENSFCSCLPSI